MANTLTGLIRIFDHAMDVVSRELVGAIPAVTIDAVAERVAKDQTIRTHVAPAASASDLTPGTTPPDEGDQTIGTVDVTISKVRKVPIRWTGEEQLSVDSGPGYENILRDQLAQAIRTLTNEIEVDILDAAYQGASRGTGVAGTTPFASGTDEAADVLKILEDNGCPSGDIHLVINTAAGNQLRKLLQLTRANEAGTDATLRRGELLDLYGMSVRQSAGVKLHTKGTGTGYLINNASNEVIGETSLTTDTGTGTMVVGDVLTHASDAVNKYIVNTAHAANTVVIGKPGLLVQADDDDALTIGANYTPNVAFHRSAMVLVARKPAMPRGGDGASDRITTIDPVTGMAFELATWGGYHRNYMEVSIAYGYKAVKSEHIAVLIG